MKNKKIYVIKLWWEEAALWSF